jgi:sister-chromatid-cohesion protein PDS5
VYRVALLCYNKSHLPGIIAFSRTDEGGLGPSAHEVLKEISTNHPKVFSTHVNDLCKALEAEAPTVNAPNPPGAVEDLKACAGFAKKFPKDLPLNAKDGKKLTQSFVNFALYGSPPEAAKHAITIIVNSDSRKEMRVKDILAKSIKGFEYGGDHFLTKLAALAQMVLFAPEDCEQEIDSIIDIAVNRVLLKAHPVTPEAESEWMDNPDEDMVARTWALKILVNRLRSFRDPKISTEVASPIYTLLNRLVKESGEASKKKLTPLAHKNLQRLLAAQFLLKLSCTRRLDALLSPTAFVELALVTHDKHAPIRKGFASKLMKYLGQNRLPTRFYSILFLFAYEPDSALLESVSTWIRSRRSAFAARKEVIFETNFARLLSILAYHPDFDTDHKTLKVMTRYILFYLKCVATADNISLIYHVAQRVKGVADGITASAQADENLYILSDLSQALIRLWEEQNGWSMQSWPGKLKLPAGIFKPLESHERAQEIADKVWIDEDLTEELEPLVRGALRSKKRRATEGTEGHRKKVKSERDVKKEKVKAEKAKTAKPKRRHKDDSDDEVDAPNAAPAAREPRRKSDRRSGVNKSYVEVSSDEDQEDEIEEDAEGGAQEDEDTDLSDPASAGEGSEPEQDVQMAEVDPEEEEEQDSNQAEVEKETSPEPPKSASKPPRRGARGKPSTALPAPSAKDDNEDDDSHIVLNGSTPAKPARGKGKAKSKAAAKEVASSSSPAVNSVRRSTRTRG